MTVASAKSIKVSGRVFDVEQLQVIRQVINASPELCRAQIAREVCDLLDSARDSASGRVSFEVAVDTATVSLAAR